MVKGTVIRQLRLQHGMTQKQLAQRLCVSDKTVSKWETGKGCPDVSLLQPLAAVFGVSFDELLSGAVVAHANASADLSRISFYVCGVCGNVLCSVGPASVSCHGVVLPPLRAAVGDEDHRLNVEPVEDEYYVTCAHEMSKTHFISFLAAVSTDRVQLVKLYPQGMAQARFKRDLVSEIYAYCNRHGLFKLSL